MKHYINPYENAGKPPFIPEHVSNQKRGKGGRRNGTKNEKIIQGYAVDSPSYYI